MCVGPGILSVWWRRAWKRTVMASSMAGTKSMAVATFRVPAGCSPSPPIVSNALTLYKCWGLILFCMDFTCNISCSYLTGCWTPRSTCKFWSTFLYLCDFDMTLEVIRPRFFFNVEFFPPQKLYWIVSSMVFISVLHWGNFMVGMNLSSVATIFLRGELFEEFAKETAM